VNLGVVTDKSTQALGYAMVLGMLSWLVWSVHVHSQEISAVKVEVELLHEHLLSSIDDRYRRSDARMDFGVVHETLNELRHRVRELEAVRP
jgi:hypothetical protein